MVLLNSSKLLEQKIESGYTVRNEVYNGSRQQVLEHPAEIEKEKGRSITIASKEWKNSQGWAELWNKIEDTLKNIKGTQQFKNANMLPSDYAALIDLVRIDLTRQTMALPDYTSVLSDVRTNPGFNKSVRLDEFLPYGAAFTEIRGKSDSVKIMEHKSGASRTVDMRLFGVGDVSSLEEAIFSGIYSLQKVNDAAARGYVAKRNDLSILGEIVAKDHSSGWTTAQKITADATSGATKEQLLYNTLVKGIKALQAMKDLQTGRVISTPSICLAIQKGTEFAFTRAINGWNSGLIQSGGVGIFQALTEIDAVVPYQGDTIYMGEQKFDYPGVPAGYAYMFVPKVSNYILEKAGLTTEIGMGSVLNLSRQERAWWFVQSAYTDEFFGIRAGSAVDGYGYVVQLALPTL